MCSDVSNGEHSYKQTVSKGKRKLVRDTQDCIKWLIKQWSKILNKSLTPTCFLNPEGDSNKCSTKMHTLNNLHVWGIPTFISL